ncbi:MAG: hypothetical protein A2X18_06470 [Bacteroidetes bacterium GWF2_40_14]|nr:MAG: hypothetical protein A2X18_06470 [Bacteroidetes bacterium GWF2_40_14]
MKRVDAITALLSAAFILLVPACSWDNNKKAVNIIDLEASVGSGKIVNIGDIVSDIRYIPLETSDSSLLGNVTKINYENGQIYVFDKKTGLLFLIPTDIICGLSIDRDAARRNIRVCITMIFSLEAVI